MCAERKHPAAALLMATGLRWSAPAATRRRGWGGGDLGGGVESSARAAREPGDAGVGRGGLAGKVAVITGAASGIGKATAAEFVRNGARVILADVQDDLGHAAAAELGPDAACYARCDVSDEAQVAAAIDLAVARYGRLDVVFNNAGVSGDMAPAPLASVDLDDFDRVMAVNARAVLAGVKLAARVMVPRRGGSSSICTASTAGVIGGGGGARDRARRGGGAGPLRRARERRLAQLHPDAAGDGRHGRLVSREERRRAPAHREGHERDGWAGAGGAGRG